MKIRLDLNKVIVEFSRGFLDFYKHRFIGDAKKQDINTHELDAITSAWAGKLYKEKKTIVLCLKEESWMITAASKGQKSLS